MTWRSKPMKNTIFGGMNIQRSQLFWCENQGTRVLTHRHMVRNKFLFTFFLVGPPKNRGHWTGQWHGGWLKSFPIIFHPHFPELGEFSRITTSVVGRFLKHLAGNWWTSCMWSTAIRFLAGYVRGPGIISCGSVAGYGYSKFNWI